MTKSLGKGSDSGPGFSDSLGRQNSPLSAREREILELVATGVTNQQIAVDLTISVNTVKAHLRSIFAKLAVESRTEATLYAIRHGLVQIDTPAERRVDTSAPEVKVSLILPPRRVQWPLLPGQRVALFGALLMVLIVAVWPGSPANSAVEESRLVDMPTPSELEITPDSHSRWRPRAQMPTPRGRFAQAEVEGIIYVIAGLAEEGWSTRVDAYYSLDDRWDRRSPKPIAVANVGAAVLNGLIYVPGGLDEASSVRDVLEIYDPHSDTWSMASPLPVPLCAYAIAPFGDGFYVIGGWDGQHYLKSVYFYDAVSDSWREEASLRVARGFATAATVGDRVYVVGGYDGAREHSLCESYDPTLAMAGQDPAAAQQLWRIHTPMSIGRAGHSMAVLQGNLYVVGGGWDTPFAYNERYDVANDAWSAFESPIIGEWRTLGLSMIDSKGGMFLYAIGGWNGRYLGVTQAYQAFYRVYQPAIEKGGPRSR